MRQFCRRTGNLIHRSDSGGFLEADQRANVETTGAGVCVVRRHRSMLGAESLDFRNVLRQMLNWDRHVFNTRDRLRVALDRHQEPEPGLSDVPDVRLLFRIVRTNHFLAWEHSLGTQMPLKFVELIAQLSVRFTVVLDGENRLRVALDEANSCSEAGLLARQFDQHPVHQLDC